MVESARREGVIPDISIEQVSCGAEEESGVLIVTAEGFEDILTQARETPALTEMAEIEGLRRLGISHKLPCDSSDGVGFCED